MGRHKKPDPKYFELTPEEELFLRRKIDFLHNCAERLKWGFIARANEVELNNIADAIVTIGQEIKAKFNSRL